MCVKRCDNASLAGRTSRRPLSDWQGAGSPCGRRAHDLPGIPLGAARPRRTGPAFWCSATSMRSIPTTPRESCCALAIALLSDRSAAAKGLVTLMAGDDPGPFLRRERRKLRPCCWRAGMTARHGEVDGLIGTSTRRAIVEEQRRLGITHPPTAAPAAGSSAPCSPRHRARATRLCVRGAPARGGGVLPALTRLYSQVTRLLRQRFGRTLFRVGFVVAGGLAAGSTRVRGPLYRWR